MYASQLKNTQADNLVYRATYKTIVRAIYQLFVTITVAYNEVFEAIIIRAVLSYRRICQIQQDLR